MAGIRTDVLKHKTTLPFNGTVNVRFYNSYSGFVKITV